jgi:hypothetical protein
MYEKSWISDSVKQSFTYSNIIIDENKINKKCLRSIEKKNNVDLLIFIIHEKRHF